MLFLCVLNLKRKYIRLLKTTPVVRGFFLVFTLMIVSSFYTLKHPFYISVVDIKQDAKQQSLNISVRLFTNDLEDALRKITGKPIDVLNPKNKIETDSVVSYYIKKRLAIQVNGKLQVLHFIGYEREEESIWAYLEIQKVMKPKIITVDTKLLYDFLPQQVNIVHTEINDIKKSLKVINPESRVEFNF
jgi:hypothetical protein